MSIYGDPATLGGSGGGTTYESLDQFQKKTLNNYTPSYSTNMRGNDNIHETHLSKSLMWHMTGSFSNTSAFSIGANVSKSVADTFAGKYLNFKYYGSLPDYTYLGALVQASVDPWANQAETNPTTIKCLIAPFPTTTYSSVFIGIMCRAHSGDTIDAYIELTITDD